MKPVILLLLAGATLALCEPLEIPLEPNNDESTEYVQQLARKFKELLEADKDLKAQFAAFEAAPKKRAGGRYLGSEARPFMLHKSVDADFGQDGGRRDYTQTIVLYYSFAEGFHKGMEETSGVFAVFHLVGHQSFKHNGGGDFELVKHTVSAKFDGFRKTLNADQDRVDEPATPPEPEGGVKVEPESGAE